MQIIALFLIQFFDSLKGLSDFESFNVLTKHHPASKHTHTYFFLIFFLSVYYFQLYYMIKLYFSCFLVHSQYNVIMIVYIGEDFMSW